MKKFLNTVMVIILLLAPSLAYGAEYDFHIEHNMNIKYAKNTDYVTVEIEYIREVENSGYFFPASGDKTFVIPDILAQSESQISAERTFKKDSITVKDVNGKALSHSLEDKEGEGIYLIVPNYKQTTKNSSYKIYITYKTHDYIDKVGQNVVIQAPSLSQDTEFTITHKDTGTKTSLEYKLDITVDKELPDLVRIWPSSYTQSSNETQNIFSFSSDSRLGKNPYLEFGTSQIYKFELEYKTPKTDSLIPEQYSKIFDSLSKNIFEISLPRYFDETNQNVKIESISPTPTKIGRDSEGNIVATFEVGANVEESISVVGYIWVEQSPLSDPKLIPNPELSSYENTILSDENLRGYLTETKYWQVNDSYIQEEAGKLKKDKIYLLDLIQTDYAYINEKLDYDQSKADSSNDRIGAKEALQGGGAVCMEYADAMITILRAQGIPARAALGYSNLKDLAHTPDAQVRHQWVQIWVPNYGWLSVDPTLESENMKIGQSIDRVLWETFSGDDLSNTKIYSADTLENISELEFNISVYALNEGDIEDIQALQSYEEVSPIEELDNQNIGDLLNKFFKASNIGRSVAIVTPILVIIGILVVSITVIKLLIKKVKLKRKKK